MADSFYLLAATFLPLLLAPVSYLCAKKIGPNGAAWFSFGVMILSTGLLLIPALSLHGGKSGYEESYTWSPFAGNFGLRLDGLSLPFAAIIYILCTVLTLYSKPYMFHKILEQFHEQGGSGPGFDPNSGSEKIRNSDSSRSQGARNTNSGTLLTMRSEEQGYVRHHFGLYYGLFLTFSMGMLGVVLATNLIEFYVFFELMLVPSFFLIAFYGYGARKRIALMFFFWTHVGAVVLLLGLLAMGFFAGGFDYDTVRAHASQIPVQWLSIIIFALVIGLGVKLAAFGLHIWLPYAHAEAPTPISALLSPAMIGIGAYGLLRLWMDLLVGDYAQYSIYINLWGLVTMIYGGAMAIMQDDIKKVLAYSSVSQMGYIIFGLGSESILGITGGTFMYVSHGLGKAILFMMAGAIILQTGTRRMSQLGGLAGKMPYTAVITMIGALTIMGVPPTTGFMAEWIMFNGVLQTGLTHGDTLRIAAFGIGILATVLTSAYILWMYKRIFFGKTPEQYAHVKDPSRYVIVTMAVLAAITLVLGVYPQPLLNPLTGYIQGMFQGNEAVLPLPTSSHASASSNDTLSNNNTLTSLQIPGGTS